jgi:hypothetical protein
MMLTLADMPIGWTAQGIIGAHSVCNFKRVFSTPLAEASASYGDPNGVPAWQQFLDAESGGTVKSDVTKALSDLSACHSFTIPPSSGQIGFTLTGRQISFPAVGEQSGAFEFRGTEQNVRFVVYVLLARFGTVVADLDYINRVSGVSSFQALVNKASAKIKAVLSA